MNNFLFLPDDTKRFVVEQTALLQGLSKQVVEKDLWVSTILEVIFDLPYADKLVFKGGTSLSKVWGLIERFSEDIDLAIDRSQFEYEGELTTICMRHIWRGWGRESSAIKLFEIVLLQIKLLHLLEIVRYEDTICIW